MKQAFSVAAVVIFFAAAIAADGSGAGGHSSTDFVDVFCGTAPASWLALKAEPVVLPPHEIAATVDVNILSFSFIPPDLTINVGDTVRWTNSDATSHTTTSNTAVWNSGNFGLNGTFSFTFNNAGTFPYHCTRHPSMMANITVQPPPTSTSTNTPTPTNTATFTATSTATNTPTATATNTPVIYSNLAPVAINAEGAGTPYPSDIGASGFANLSAPNSTVITKVTVDLIGMSHTNPDDMDIMLVGPLGQTAIIMSDVGGGNPLTNVTLTLDDDAAASLPDDTQIASGTFKPTNFDASSDAFPAPAPASAGGSALSVFNGTDPNGTWSLYVYDDQSGEAGSISGGWSLNITTTVGTISGTVTYGNAAAPPKYISNVTVNAAGSPNLSTTTAAPGGTAGQYSLTGFGAGSYTVSLSKTTGQNSINSFDAARIAQHVSGTLLLTNNNQKIAADVTGNGAVSSQDAAKIAQVVTGLPFSPPNLTGTWQFYVSPGPTFPVGTSPTTRTYSSVTSNITGDDYIGLLIGEVTGNWTASAARPSGRRQPTVGNGPERSVALDLPNVAAPAGNEIVVPVSVHGAANKGVISYEFDVRYDPSIIQPRAFAADVSGTVSRGLSVVTNPTKPGILRVVVYGPVPISDDGLLLNLRFTAVGKPGAVSPLTWERVMFNEGEPRVNWTGGQVELF